MGTRTLGRILSLDTSPHLNRTVALLETPIRGSSAVRYPSTIEQREVPPNDGSRAQFVWFALASASFFSHFTNSAMVPIWSPEDPATRRQPFEMLTFVDGLSGSPGLPGFASFVNDGFYRSYNPATRSVDVIALKPPYDRGYTNAFYRATDVNNSAGLALPARFIFMVYSTPLGVGEVPFERSVAEGVVHHAEPAPEEAAGPPAFQGVASVADYRISTSDSRYPYAAYSITNGQWLNGTGVEALRVQIENQARAGAPRGAAKTTGNGNGGAPN